MNPKQDGRGLILMVEHLGNDDGLGWCFTVDLWKTRGHHGNKFAWRKGVSDSICHSAEVSDGSCGLPLVKSFLILCKYDCQHIWCLVLVEFVEGKKKILISIL